MKIPPSKVSVEDQQHSHLVMCATWRLFCQPGSDLDTTNCTNDLLSRCSGHRLLPVPTDVSVNGAAEGSDCVWNQENGMELTVSAPVQQIQCHKHFWCGFTTAVHKAANCVSIWEFGSSPRFYHISTVSCSPQRHQDAIGGAGRLHRGTRHGWNRRLLDSC